MIFMIFGPGGRDHDSKKPFILGFGDTKLLQQNQENSRSILGSVIFGNLRSLESENFEKNGKDVRPQILKTRLINS